MIRQNLRSRFLYSTIEMDLPKTMAPAGRVYLTDSRDYQDQHSSIYEIQMSSWNSTSKQKKYITPEQESAQSSDQNIMGRRSRRQHSILSTRSPLRSPLRSLPNYLRDHLQWGDSILAYYKIGNALQEVVRDLNSRFEEMSVGGDTTRPVYKSIVGTANWSRAYYVKYSIAMEIRS